MPLVEVNGAETFYEVAGTGSPVVLLHSGLADSRSWDPQFASWSRERLVVRHDLRGFGRSSLPPGPYSLVDDLRALLDHLAIERAALAGLSLGGRVALDFTLTHPDRVGALVLAGSGLGGFEWSKELASVMGREDDLLDAGDLDGATELMLETWVAGPRRALEDVDPGLRSTIAAMQREAYEVLLRAYSGPEQPGPGTALVRPARRGAGADARTRRRRRGRRRGRDRGDPRARHPGRRAGSHPRRRAHAQPRAAGRLRPARARVPGPRLALGHAAAPTSSMSGEYDPERAAPLSRARW